MSTRHRAIAGAPERSAAEAAATIVEMLSNTLSAASAIDTETVARELDTATGAIRMLVAGKHLGTTPLVLRAEPLRLEVTVVTGGKALVVEENLGKVPGAATASSWTLHVPAPEPIQGWVTGAVQGLTHVTTDPAPAETAALRAAVEPADVDLTALRRAAGGCP